MNDYEYEQLTQSARDSNLADYFLQSGYTTERFGAEVYIKEFPGLCVNMKTNKWYSHYEGVGGGNSIDCLVKVCGHDFKQAVLELTGQDIPRFIPQQKVAPESVKKDLCMPERGENMRRVFAYFCKERKIPAAIVEELAKANLLYQSAGQVATIVDGVPQTAKPPNAVFVHYPLTFSETACGEAALTAGGSPVGGEVQGVNSYKRYKGLVAGTGDSVFSFSPTFAKVNTAYLFESGIDLMSFYALCDREKLQGVSLLSMAGLKPSVPNRLREQGVSVLSFVDNDEAGRKFERDNNFKRGCDTLELAGVKDWSDALKCGVVESVEVITSDNKPDCITAKGGIRK